MTPHNDTVQSGQPRIKLATVLAGAEPFNEGNVSRTFRGQVLLDDQTTRGAILKDISNRELANELLAFLLARAAGLPTPDAYVGLVRDKEIPTVMAPRLPSGEALVFVSTDVKVPDISFQIFSGGLTALSKIYDSLSKWAHLGDLYAFDAWIANVDRHDGNLLFSSPNDFWLIDHGYCFSGPSWTVSDLVPDKCYRHRLSNWLTPELTSSQRTARLAEAERFSKTLNREATSACTKDDTIAQLLDPNDIGMLDKFLSERIINVPRCAGNALEISALI